MKRIYFFIGTLLLIGLLFWGGSVLASSKTPEQQQLDSLQDQAANASDPAVKALLQQKAEPLSAAQAAQATAQANAPDKPSDVCGLRPAADPNATPAPTIEIPRGISDWLQPPFSPQEFSVTNQWNDQVDGVWLTAYAGVLGDDPDQGAIVAVDAQGNYFRYLLNRGSGAARFAAADGSLLTVETGNGSTYQLDMAALTLTDAQGQVLQGVQQAAPATVSSSGPCQ
ncbi:hypothetical protein LARV_00750 [Longilinea arvoryzae]|uniref:Uncharacterized protein n=1 Tax=Longilinea arvoryzae TaxID=360412 RepID=A0A0S7BGQ9_9CHLR|nr:hypothetical protein [Longilinea arvoryzae]GAP13009.1 hypothetical protein LARV_00750 [Longilinea arvoryzae]